MQSIKEIYDYKIFLNQQLFISLIYANFYQGK